MSAKIMEEISRRKVFCDGGMGSLLQAKGLKAGELPETWNVLRPEILREIHKAYLEAGCDIVRICGPGSGTYGKAFKAFGGSGF